MAGSSIEGADFADFYDLGDFGVQAEFAGDLIDGLFNEEELETETISGIYPTFRCAVRIDENSSVRIDGSDYIVEYVMRLEFGEFLHALSIDDDA